MIGPLPTQQKPSGWVVNHLAIIFTRLPERPLKGCTA